MKRQALAESIAFTRQLTESSQKKAGQSQKKAGQRDRARGADSGVQVSIGIPGISEVPDRSFFEEGFRYNWTKTQFAGAKVHIAVCAILRYVKQRYAPELEIDDDSGYFDDGDYEKLETQLAHVDYLNSLASQAVKAAASSKSSMTLDTFVDRINEELAQAKNKLH